MAILVPAFMNKALVVAVGLVAVLGFAALGPSLARVALQVGHDDQVHYVGHLVAGRVLSLCSCTATLAERQYARGVYHARTPRQLALLTTARPTTLDQRLKEAPEFVSALVRRVAG
jgi:hypothetical protein